MNCVGNVLSKPKKPQDTPTQGGAGRGVVVSADVFLPALIRQGENLLLRMHLMCWMTLGFRTLDCVYLSNEPLP